MGGDEISTSRAVVNRILLGGPNRDLCVQIHPSVQLGQAGGPAFLANGQLVGMASCGRDPSQLGGYVIPTAVIRTFLQNAQKHGLYTMPPFPGTMGAGYNGECTLVPKSVDCYRVQPLENVELRLQLGLPGRPAEGEEGGVLVTRVPKDSPSYGLLREMDVRVVKRINTHQSAIH